MQELTSVKRPCEHLLWDETGAAIRGHPAGPAQDVPNGPGLRASFSLIPHNLFSSLRLASGQLVKLNLLLLPTLILSKVFYFSFLYYWITIFMYINSLV